MAKRERTRKVPVALPSMETAPEHWLRNIRISGLAFTILAFIVLGIVVLAPSLRTAVSQRQEIAALKSDVVNQNKKVDELKNDVARWDDPAYIETQARERIYYVYPGERPYIVIGDETAKSASNDTTTPISDSIQTTKVDWMQSLVSSVFTAGLTTETTEQLENDAK